MSQFSQPLDETVVSLTSYDVVSRDNDTRGKQWAIASTQHISIHFSPMSIDAAFLRLKEWYRAPTTLSELKIILDVHQEVR